MDDSAYQEAREALLADYVFAEDALRAFTDRNFGRLCAICARWTLLATQVNAAVVARSTEDSRPPAAGATPSRQSPEQLTWRVQSWVTNCCNANHALESMSETSLAGIVASRAAGRSWWREVKRAAAAPCSALTDQGCHLRRGRPELCNRYFCEAVRDYLWLIGGDRRGPGLATRLDEMQRRWTTLYVTYQDAVAAAAPVALPDRLDPSAPAAPPGRHQARGRAGWAPFLKLLSTFDQEIAACARAISAGDLSDRLFKVAGEREVYEPFFARETEAVAGMIRNQGS